MNQIAIMKIPMEVIVERMMINQKVCTQCNHLNPLSDYYRSKKGLYGRVAKCKSCLRDNARTNEGREGQRLRSKKYYLTDTAMADLEYIDVKQGDEELLPNKE